jgi:hypothetical protein
MALTSAQKQTLKAAILADPAISQTFTDGNLQGVADYYNALASPAFIVWRTDVPTKDVKKALVWTEYVGRSAGERDAFALMISNGIVNAADTNIRAGFNDIFSGPSGVNTRAALVAIAKRSATRAEQLFATGTGSDAVPATMTVEGSISYTELIGL